jgi:hypothetical protein
MKDFNGNTDMPGFSPLTKHKVTNKDLDDIAPLHDWELHDGYKNFSSWIDEAVINFQKINHFRG